MKTLIGRGCFRASPKCDPPLTSMTASRDCRADTVRGVMPATAPESAAPLPSIDRVGGPTHDLTSHRMAGADLCRADPAPRAIGDCHETREFQRFAGRGIAGKCNLQPETAARGARDVQF